MQGNDSGNVEIRSENAEKWSFIQQRPNGEINIITSNDDPIHINKSNGIIINNSFKMEHLNRALTPLDTSHWIRLDGSSDGAGACLILSGTQPSAAGEGRFALFTGTDSGGNSNICFSGTAKDKRLNWNGKDISVVESLVKNRNGYIRYTNGLQVEFFNFTLVVPANSVDYQRVCNYPIAFVDKPYSINVSYGSEFTFSVMGNLIGYYETGRLASTNFQIIYHNHFTQELAVTFYVTAIGAWK